MTSHVPGPRSRAVIPLLVVLLGVALGAGGVLLLRPFGVLSHATSVTATLTSTGKSYPARIVGVDVGADIAVLQLEGASGLTPAPIGDSATVTLGTPVLAIGNQAGAGGSPTIAPGIINSLNRTIQANDGASGFTETLHGMLQTSARIEPGDSGGPLADAAGAVIGVDTAAGTGTAAAGALGALRALGYAIPIDGAMAVERQIAAGHPVPGIVIGEAGFLGVVVPSSTSRSPRLQGRGRRVATGGAQSRPSPGCLETEAAAGVPAVVAPARSGALVDGVLRWTGAAKAGIEAGDVITAADGHPVSSPDALIAIVSACRPGTLVRVTWVSTAGTTRASMVPLDVAPAL